MGRHPEQYRVKLIDQDKSIDFCRFFDCFYDDSKDIYTTKIPANDLYVSTLFLLIRRESEYYLCYPNQQRTFPNNEPFLLSNIEIFVLFLSESQGQGQTGKRFI